MDPVVTVRVAGVPAPQGSKTPKIVHGRPELFDANARALRPWRRAVTAAARAAVFQAGAGDWTPIAGPVAVRLVFGFVRPVSHPRRTRTWPIGIGTVGDIDKLARAVLDSLTDAGVWRDDAVVTELSVSKDWTGQGRARLLNPPGGVVARVWRVDEMTTGELPVVAQ